MKKMIRLLMWVFIGFVVLLAGAAIFIKVKFPPERVKELVLARVQEKLHRQAEVGDVSIGLLKGVELSNFKLSERPDFSKGSFVKCKSFRLGFSLLTILKGKLVLSQILLDSPRIHVVRMADGKTFNFSDITRTSAPAEASSKSQAGAAGGKVAGAAAALLVEKITIRNGEVQFIDRAPQEGYDVGLHNLDFSVSGFSLVRPFKATLSVDTNLRQGRKTLAARLGLSGKVSIAGKGRAQIDKLTLVSGKTDAEVSGTVEDLLGEPQADLRVQLKSFDPATAAFFAPLPDIARSMALSADLNVKGTQTNIQGSGAVNIDVAGLKGTLRISDMAYKAAQEPFIRLVAGLENIQPSKALPMKDVNVSGTLGGQIRAEGTLNNLEAAVDIDASQLKIQYADLLSKGAGVPAKLSVKTTLKKQETAELKDLKVLFGPLDLSASGVVSGLTQGKTSVNLRVDLQSLSLGELASLVGPVRAYKPEGIVSANLRVSGTQDNPLAEGTVRVKDVSAEAMPGIPVSGINSTVQLKANSASIPSLTGQLMGSPFKISLSVQNFSAPRVVFDGNLEKLDAGKVLAALSPEKGKGKAGFPAPVPPQAAVAVQQAGGASNIPFALKMNFVVGQVTHPYYAGGPLKLTADLSGKGSDTQRLKGTAGVQMGRGEVQNIPLVSALARVIDPTMSVLSYDSLMASLVFDNGKVRVTDGRLNGQISLTVTGTYTFQNDGLDFNAQVRIPKDKVHPIIAQYAAVGTDDVVPVNMGVGGTLEKPRYSLKAAEMVKERVTEEIKQKAGDLIQKQLQNIFKF